MGRRAKRVESPGRKARRPTERGAHTAAVSAGSMPVRIATKVTSTPMAEAKTKATNVPSPSGAAIMRITDATSTAAQASRNCSLPTPRPSLSGRSPAPATAELVSAPMPSAMDEPRSA